MDYYRKGKKNRGAIQPMVGATIAGLLPPDLEIHIINETWEDPDWNEDYDLLFISSLHSDFDRARQISHYWRRRGTKTVYGGNLASNFPLICKPFFDSVVVGDPEGIVPQIFQDFLHNSLRPLYVSGGFDAHQVPVPRFDLLAGKHTLPLSLEATRGCPFSCDFCVLTGLGTRFHSRPVGLVIRDIREGQRMLKGKVPPHQVRIISFLDNNIGGDPNYLKNLCQALTPLKIHWGSSITYNIAADPDIIEQLSRSGCRLLYIGLESFSPETLADMNKRQNATKNQRLLFENCRKKGILIMAGLMVSPVVDDCTYLQSIPQNLEECGLHLPNYISFECPIPGTPYFERLAEQKEPAFLPNALLRDFNGYTLTVKPKKESPEDFIEAYRNVLDNVYNTKVKLHKYADDMRYFLPRGFLISSIAATTQLFTRSKHSDPDRTYTASTDVEPPEARTVPFTDNDFISEEERKIILDPMRVADDDGHILPIWRQHKKFHRVEHHASEEKYLITKSARSHR